METIDVTKIPRWESKMPCLPQPDLFEEMVLLSRLNVKVEFNAYRTEIGTFRAMVSVKSPGDGFPWAREFFLYERDALAAWLRQVRLGAEMTQEYREQHPPV